MEEITPEQKNNLKTWAGQRDFLLSEISNLRNQKEKLILENQSISNSYTDVESRMNQIIGRIEELKEKENEIANIISKENSYLEKEKTVLQSEISNLTKMIDVLKSQKQSLEEDIKSQLFTFETVKSESLLLENVLGSLVTINNKNVSDINSLINNLGNSLNEIIEVNKKNVYETNIVIDKLPKMLVEIQKRGLIKNKL